MLKFLVIGLAVAQENLNDNECTGRRSCWTSADIKFEEPLPECTVDADCAAEHYCLDYMWAYNDQTSSGRGCWEEAICAGNGSYMALQSERKMQWFCSEDQLTANQGKSTLYDLEPTAEKHWNEYSVACETDADCPRPDLNQYCTNDFWEVTEDGDSFSNGRACYNW